MWFFKVIHDVFSFMFNFHCVTIKQIYAGILKCLKSLSFRDPDLPKTDGRPSFTDFSTLVGSHFRTHLEMR